jgi:hypothetical protein
MQDDLSTELEAAAPLQLVNRVTVGLAGLVLALGGFIAGVQVQKSTGTPAASADPRVNFGAGGPDGGFGQNPGGGENSGTQDRAASLTTGTVKLVDGTTVYVETADGTVVTVRTSTGTAVQLAQTAKVSDLKTGATVTVEGAAGTDGVVTATKVTGQK